MIPVWLALGSLSLGLPRAVLRVLVPLKWTWIPLFFAQFLELVCFFGDVGDHYGGFIVAVAGWIVVGVGGVGCWCLVGMVKLMLPLVECPGRELAVLEGCYDV